MNMKNKILVSLVFLLLKNPFPFLFAQPLPKDRSSLDQHNWVQGWQCAYLYEIWMQEELTEGTLGELVNLRRIDNTCPLHEAARIGSVHCIRALVKLKVNPNSKDIDGNTALHFSTWNRSTLVIKTLAILKADLNLKNKRGNTCLHLATQHTWTEGIEVLASLGANLNIQNSEGNTALHLSLSSEEPALIVGILRNFGADPNIRNNRGQTPLDLAIQLNNLEMIDLLQRFTAERALQVNPTHPSVMLLGNDNHNNNNAHNRSDDDDDEPSENAPRPIVKHFSSYPWNDCQLL